MKVRCSALGQVMTNSRKKGELSKTAQSYLKKCLKEELYDTRITFSNKYTEKGIEMEEEAIELVADRYDLGFLDKNEEHFSNEFITGTPDVITSDTVRDIKCSWSLDTFPAFEEDIPTKDYYWQLQGYMWLTGKDVAYLDYCLMDTPALLIDSELKRLEFSKGSELTEDQADEAIKQLTFSRHEPALRVKTFRVERNEEEIEAIKARVNECRTYINNLKTSKQNGN